MSYVKEINDGSGSFYRKSILPQEPVAAEPHADLARYADRKTPRPVN
jgi:hypothetical protein